MSTKSSTRRVRQIYQFIDLHKRRYPVEVMCKVLAVAPSGYYEWVNRPLSDHAIEDVMGIPDQRDRSFRTNVTDDSGAS